MAIGKALFVASSMGWISCVFVCVVSRIVLCELWISSVLQCCRSVTERDVETILQWAETSKQQREVPFLPSRVLLQDFT